ncbi:MAG: citrate/2-methylcitrate synthase, partial [Actinomycetota bacterium]|nr:citrate/2-methylcitrate synthase [Actinomycetota bacterium]
MADSITITDNRTGRTVEVPLVDGTVSAKAWSSLLPGVWFDDPSFSATSGADSAITFLDGGAGLLHYRGYPIEQLAERTTFLEVAHLLVRDELPTASQLKDWQGEIAEAAPIHENFHKRIF